VHRERQGRRAAVGRQHAQDVGELGVRGAAATELGGHPRREDPMRTELGVVVGHERVVGVVGGRPRREGRPELPDDGDPAIG
jgi:hypothetical protein